MNRARVTTSGVYGRGSPPNMSRIRPSKCSTTSSAATGQPEGRRPRPSRTSTAKRDQQARDDQRVEDGPRDLDRAEVEQRGGEGPLPSIVPSSQLAEQEPSRQPEPAQPAQDAAAPCRLRSARPDASRTSRAAPAKRDQDARPGAAEHAADRQPEAAEVGQAQTGPAHDRRDPGHPCSLPSTCRQAPSTADRQADQQQRERPEDPRARPASIQRPGRRRAPPAGPPSSRPRRPGPAPARTSAAAGAAPLGLPADLAHERLLVRRGAVHGRCTAFRSSRSRVVSSSANPDRAARSCRAARLQHRRRRVGHLLEPLGRHRLARRDRDPPALQQQHAAVDRGEPLAARLGRNRTTQGTSTVRKSSWPGAGRTGRWRRPPAARRRGSCTTTRSGARISRSRLIASPPRSRRSCTARPRHGRRNRPPGSPRSRRPSAPAARAGPRGR